MKNYMTLLKDMEYVRTGGSKEELKCAEFIQEQLKEIGLDSHLEEFEVTETDVEYVSLKVTKPYEKTIPCKAYFNCANVDNLTKEVYYMADQESEISYNFVKDKIVMIDGYLRYWPYKKMIENGAVGVISCNGSLYVEDCDIDQREIREPLASLGKLPAVQINSKDFFEMVKNDVKEVSISVKEDTHPGVSRNVVTNIEGTSDKTIVFTAHYDSTSLSKGSYDNATGVVALLHIAEYFMNKKPLHNLIFVFCGSEERGLLGSKAYCKAHKDELDKIDFDLNVDMIGSYIGPMGSYVMAERKLMDYVEYVAREEGYPIKLQYEVGSTDMTPFADNGIPALAFCRFSNMNPIHCRFDDTQVVSEKQLTIDINFITKLADRFANAKTFMVKRVVPDDMKEKIDVYLLRKEPKKN